AELETQGVADNTLILFVSDNGRAFPREKTTLYDVGIKTPWIMKWPGHIKAGTVNPNLVSSIDIAPTFMRAAQLDPLPIFEGYDIGPTLAEEMPDVRQFIYAEDHFHDFEDYTRAVRTERYKYIKNFYPDLPNTPSADILRDRSWQSMLQEREAGTLTDAQLWCFNAPRPEEELYDLGTDPYELNNLAGTSAAQLLLDSLRQILVDIRATTKDYLPAQRMPEDFFRATGYPTKYRIRPRPSKAVYEEAARKGIVLENPDFEQD
ncbi:MAG: sulfatase/phosphatase domain-containing protein, partial [Bacteroidota bacterium]